MDILQEDLSISIVASLHGIMRSHMHFFQEAVNLISLLKFVIKETNEDLISTSGTLGWNERRDRAEQYIM
jgi:hypothetical protein